MLCGILFIVGFILMDFSPLAGFIVFGKIWKILGNYFEADKSENKKLKVSIWVQNDQFYQKIDEITKIDEIFEKLVFISNVWILTVFIVSVLKIIIGGNFGQIFLIGNFILAKMAFGDFKFRNLNLICKYFY